MKTPQSAELALKLLPGFELDVFVFRYVLDGIVEVAQTPKGNRLERPIPNFSRSADAAKMLLIKMVMEAEQRQVNIYFGEEWWGQGHNCGQLPFDKSFPAWKVSIQGRDGFGRTLEEAICKLAIVTKRDE
jgi:hypothetical protein